MPDLAFEHPRLAAVYDAFDAACPRREMVEAARHQGREPDAGLVLRLVELHRQIHIAEIERAAGVEAEDPDLAHPRQVGAVTANDASEQTFDPLRRLRPLHGARLMRRPRRTRSVPLARESFPATILVPVPEPTATCDASDTAIATRAPSGTR
jgi:hypothetical protein